MRARTFASLMFLLLAFAAVLLVIAGPEKRDTKNPAGTGHNTHAQVADGFMIWESVSTHLLGILQ